MNKIILATLAAAAVALPSDAIAQGKGKGHSVNAHTSATVSNGKARTDSRAHVRATTRTGASVNRTRDDRVLVRDSRRRNSALTTTGNRWNGYACAPGLADRVPACVPPGQLQRPYRVDQRLPDNYRYYVDRSAIPNPYFGRLPDEYESGAYRYVYSPDRSIYVVDPATNLIRYVLDL